MATAPWRSERGQATLEWTALVAVVAVVLAVGGAVAGAPGIVNAVGGALRRALCLVGGGDCRAPEPKACVMSSSDSSLRAGVTFTFVKLGGRVGLLREERSDGTFRLTLVDDVEAGLTAGRGYRARFELEGLLSSRVGAMSQVEVLARLGRRRAWTVSSDREADALERRIKRSVGERLIPKLAVDLAAEADVYDPADLPAPDESSLGGELEGSAALGLALSEEARAGLTASLGAVRQSDGTTRVTFALEAGGSADLRRTFFGFHAEGEGSAAVTVSFDRRGRARELEVAASAGGDAQAALPDAVPHGAGRAERGGRMEVSATLDLTTSDHAAVAERVLAALAPGHAGELPGAAAELARRISSSGTMSAELRTTSRDAVGGELEGGAGPKIGGLLEASRMSTALSRAWWRPPGGVWDLRVDCGGHRA